MLRLTRLATAALEGLMESATDAQPSSPRLLTLEGGLLGPPPPGFAHDMTRTELGNGQSVFRAGREALSRWEQFDLGWVRVANQNPSIATGAMVAVEANMALIWSINFSRITETMDTPARFGFLYTTTRIHVEEGQERFVIEYDEASGCVSYLIEAVSRPRHLLARIACPFSRAMQHRFARDSHRRMLRSVLTVVKPR